MPQDKIETYNLTAILENMLDSVWTINKAYEVVYLNTVFENAFFSAFGIHLKKGATILEKMPAQLALIWKERYDKALANERLIIEDKIDFGAAFVFIEVRLNPIVVENKVVGVSIISRDITQRRQAEEALKLSEEKYRRIFEDVQDVFLQTDLQGTILEISPSIIRFSGKTREETLGTSLLDLYYNPEDREPLLENLLRDGEIRDYELRIRSKTRALIHVSVNARLVLDAEGNLKNMEGVLRDVTERKSHELEIATQNIKLQIQNKELEQYTHIASHDLQEPLRTLSSIGALIQEEFKGKLNETADLYLDFIVQSSNRMKELVKGLLDYSRIGKENELTTIDCNEILKEVLSDMSTSIKESGAAITVSELPSLSGYSIELRLLFQNLLSNALKFRSTSIAPQITITAKKQEAFWLFSIKDNGIGIDERGKDKIFIIFKRLHNRNDYEGTGIGLSHCKKIAELHGGTIWVDSKLGEGSVFHFTIPIL